MVTETSGTRTGTLDSEYENIGIIPIYFVFHCPLGLCNPSGFAGGKKGALLWNKLSRLQKLHRVTADIYGDIGVKPVVLVI